jgi:DNA polymerase-1
VPKQSLLQRVDSIIKAVETKKAVPRARWGKVADDDEVPGLADALAELGDMPITTLDDVPRALAVRYAGRDADATARIEPILSKKMEVMELEGIEALDLSIIPMVERMQRNGMPARRGKLVALGDFCLAHMGKVKLDIPTAWTDADVRRYNVMTRNSPNCFPDGIDDINPDSPNQTRDLLYGVCGLTTDRKTPSGKELSTDDKTLGELAGHPVVDMVRDYREHSKIRNSFATVLPYRLSADGRVRCTLRVTRVSSGRLAASDPNLLAQPVRSELGRRLRACFECAPGHRLGAWDLDQVEMRYMAHESRDPILVRLFLDGIDVHSQTASKVFGVPIDQVDPFKHRLPAKRIGFGVITGITGKGL